MEEKQAKWEVAKYMEEYRYRLIDQQAIVGGKSMDLGTDRLLKDCELYITLFGLLVAGLAFVYGGLSGNTCTDILLKIMFFLNLVIIFSGIIWAFVLRQRMSGNIENYTKSNSDILGEEINQLTWENPPKELPVILEKRLKESKELLISRREKLNNLVHKYQLKEKGYLIEKNIIFIIYIVSFFIFVGILGILLFT